ncbi:facilitated trehalose transporter Tret1-like isoform X2 [Anoplophora glabripennis]|uniref:facilitated trehalose transporter Tret1-like isoform X2 n=1 Tax=Anoplophora glabripennis TaxID=217634 RepID=UPI0008753863|nr:facilitated trehalose transporter Tret1-like isoform X2 [Anoplophora glabripennis]
MDPISASCFSLHIQENQRAIAEEQKQDEKFSEIIVSCKSLSRYDGRTFKTLVPQILAAVIVASYHIVVGISLAYSAILIPSVDPNNTEFRAEDGIVASKTECSWIASVIVIVVPIGAITGGFFMDSIGRLNTIKMAAIPSLLGWSLIALAQNVPMVIAGRLLAGFASAWGTSPAIVYMTEIGRADLRGSLISCAPTFASLGMVICFLKGWFMHWKTVAWLSNIYAVVPCILICFIPESPAWLVSKGRIEQAAKSLQWINKYQPQPENRNESLAELQLNFLQKEHQQKLEQQSLKGSGALVKLKEFFKPTGYKPIIILFGLFFFQQFSGIYITLFYSVTFFQDVGSTINPYLASVLIGTVRMLMSCVNTYMLRTFQRRPLIMVSGLGMAICMGFSGLFTYWIKQNTLTQNWMPVVLLLLYVVTSMIGLLNIPWTMTAELFPIEIRGMGHSISLSIANLLMFVAVQLYYPLSSILGGIVMVQWFFGVMSITASLYVFVILPETHNKKLSEITEYFNEKTIYLSLGKKKSTTPQRRRRVEKRDIVRLDDQSQKLMNSV